MGTTIVSLVSQITGNINAGVGMIAVLFVAGIILFRKSVSLCNIEKGEEVYPAPEMPQRSSI
jgi:UMF1 family MFS transporter